MDREVNLTHEGLSRLGFARDFVIHTDNPKSDIMCSRSQISFISPAVSKLLHSDPTISEFKLRTPDSSKCISLIESLLNGRAITVTGGLVSVFNSIAVELGSDELLFFIEDDLTVDNIFEIIQVKFLKSLDCEREIEFIASHFYEYKVEDISSLDVSIIDSIISSKSLVVESEHDLFKFIRRLISIDRDEYKFLLSHLHIENLSREDTSIFIEFIDDDNIGSFMPCISRILLDSSALNLSAENNKRYQTKYVRYKENKFDGIFSYLWKENNCNPVSSGIVDIEGINYENNSDPSSLVDPEKRSREDWYCGNTNGDGIIFDFKGRKISLNGYSLKSPSSYGSNFHFMKSWKIEGSNDKNVWTLIDRQRSDALESSIAEGYWSCKQSPPFRFIRIKMNGRNTQGKLYLYLHAIDFFGSFIDL